MRIPVPLNALRAFETAARLGSLKAAAAELGVTPSAVSHQVRTLEQALGVELLQRDGRQLVLTAAGRALQPGLESGFGRVAETVQQFSNARERGPLRVTMLPTFTNNWLSPRLAAAPLDDWQIELEINSTQQLADLNAGEADAAILYGQGDFPGLSAELLFETHLDLYVSPGTISGSLEERAARVSEQPLFVSRQCPDWEAWLNDVPGGPITPRTVHRVDSSGLTLQAAADRAGVAIAVVELAQSSVRSGRLVSVFDYPRVSEASFYLVTTESMASDARIRRFRDWLLAAVHALD